MLKNQVILYLHYFWMCETEAKICAPINSCLTPSQEHDMLKSITAF